jgi:hypothetical protein
MKFKEKWVSVLEYLNIPGGVVLGLFSLEMLAIISYYAVKGINLPSTVRDVYLGVVTAFAASNIAKYYGQKGNKNETKVN